MIRTLRKKFILIAVGSFAAALVLILSVINAVSYYDVTRTSRQRLDMLSYQGQNLPDGKMRGFDAPTGELPSAPANGEFPDGGFMLDGGIFGFNSRRLSKEAPFDSRYFSVSFNSDGEITDTDTEKIASVTAGEAREMAQKLYKAGKTEGTASTYRYRATVSDGTTTYTFLDCARELNTFYSFLTVSCLTALAGLGIVTVLVVVFSKVAIRPVAESYEKQKRFITDASHELKTPLAVINAANEVTEMEAGETEWTRSIDKQVKRLTSLTEKLVMLSRMDEESYQPAMVRFDLSAAVEETAHSFDSVAQSRKKEYTVSVEQGVSYTGDENALRQLTSLLIDNAMKYSDENGKIAVSLKKSGKNTELRVENSVESIQKGNQDILFERFYRSDTSRNSATGGHGIGLSVAKAIVTAHKGRITAVSPDAKSIVFTAVL